jgi:hypothetical protein
MTRTLARFGALALALGAALPAPAQIFTRHGEQFQVGPQPSAIAARDLNDDGLPDIVTADRGQLAGPREERPANDELSVLIASEKLNYTRRHPSLKTGFAPYSIALSNIDALKWPDIVVASFHSTRGLDISLFLNLKQEDVFKPHHFAIAEDSLLYGGHRDGDGNPLFTSPGLTSLVVHDFNGDGLRDLVAASWSCDVLVYMPGHLETFFGEPAFLRAPGAPRDLALGDFDGDGNMDVAVCYYQERTIGLWRGDGAGGFDEQTRFNTRGRLPVSLQAADLNNDGKLDLAVGHAYADDSVVLFYGDGAFGFPLSQEFLFGEDREVLEHEVRGIALGDYDRNGWQDVAAACYASGKVIVMCGRGVEPGSLPAFEKQTYEFPDAKPRALCTADFNADGTDDLGVALWETDTVGLLLGRSTGG